jgi:eukaryotic-like serine/threonine-protein kinase
VQQLNHLAESNVPVEWQRLKDAFITARQLAPELRPTFVDHVCGDQTELRRELELLLQAHEHAASLVLDPQTITRLSEPSEDTPAVPPSHPRFEILRRVGEGGMGIVYLALDRDHQAQVALKTIGKMGATSLLRFKNEFRALADVVHPHLVRLFELLGGDAAPWFFTMEYVVGVPFVEHVRPRTAPVSAQLDIARLRAAFPQLVEAVATIHAAGKLHCDLKPSNVLVAQETHRVVVLDFGLVTEIEAPTRPSSSRSITGTIAFMSPEQARGDRLTEASDWYSVGVILYEALTGRLPIDGPDLGMLLERKRDTDPQPPQTLDPTLPDDLSRLCMGLLDRDPRARPDGRTVLRLLERPSTIRRDGGSRFVGRERQLALMHEALREVRAGSQQTIYVHGPSGVGKTALTQRFLEDVEGEALVLAGRCYERESVPYKAFDAVMDDLVNRLGTLPETARLLDDNAAYLARVFPILTQLASVRAFAARARTIADLQEVRRRAFAGLRELLRRLAGRYLLIVSIDDLQWSDLDSTGLLQTLLAPPNPPRLLFLGSYRSEYAETSQVLKRLLMDEGARRIEVGLLSEEDSAALARTILGEPASASTIDTVVREGGGIPLFIEQLARAVDQMVDDDRGERLSFDAVLVRRLALLDASSRRLLEHVVVGGQPLPQGAIARAANLTPEQALRDLATLRSQQWVRTHGIAKDDNIEPFHDRIRESITASLAPDVLSHHHLALAQALEPMAVDPEVLAVHWAGGGRFTEATHYATQAADRAAATLAFNRAARLYALALGWQPSNSDNARLLKVGLATALAHAGRSIEAGDAYLSATEGTAVDDARLYKQRAAEQYLNHGHVEKGYDVLVDLVQAVGLRMPKRGAFALTSLFIERARLRMRGLAYRRTSRPAREAILRQIDVCLVVGKGLSMIEPLSGAEFQTRAVRLALSTGDPRRVAIALALEGPLEGIAGHRARRRVDRILDQSEKLAAELDDVQITAQVRFLRGVVHYLRGEWQASLVHCREAETLFRERCVNVWWEIDQSASYVIWNLCYLGRLGEAAARVRPLLKEASERGDRLLTSQLLTGITVLVPLSQEEDSAQVREQLIAGVSPWQGQSYNMPHLLVLFGLGQIDLYLGRGGDAWSRVERDWSQVRSSLLLKVQFLRIEFLGLLARCALAAATEAPDPRRLLAKARRAAGALERIGTSWARAYATPVRAQLEIAAGEYERAAGLLTTASERFDGLGMRLHAAAAGYRAAGLADSAAGRSLKAASTSEMRTLGIKDPEAMTRVLVPLSERLRRR